MACIWRVFGKMEHVISPWKADVLDGKGLAGVKRRGTGTSLSGRWSGLSYYAFQAHYELTPRDIGFIYSNQKQRKNPSSLTLNPTPPPFPPPPPPPPPPPNSIQFNSTQLNPTQPNPTHTKHHKHPNKLRNTKPSHQPLRLRILVIGIM